MASDIEDLIVQQEMTNLQLKLMEDNKDTFNDILDQSKESNDLLGSNSNSINKLIVVSSDIIKSINSGFASIKLEPSLNPAPIVNVTQNEPLLLNPAQTEQPNFNLPTPIVNNTIEPPSASASPINVSPVIQSPEQVQTASEDLTMIENNGEEQISLLSTVASGILSLVDDVKEKAKSLLAVDRQKDSGSSEGLFSGLSGKIGPAIAKLGLIGLVAGGVFQLVSGIFEGFADDKLIKEISGKSRGDLTASEETLAILSNAVSKVFFGLFDAKDIFNFFQPIAKGIQTAIDKLFDPETGILGGFVTSFFKLIDGNISGAFKELSTAGITALSRLVGLLPDIGDLILDLLPSDLSKSITDSLDIVLQPLAEFFVITLPRTFSDAVDSITNGFDFILELPSKIGNIISEFASNVISGLIDKVKTFASDLPFGIGDKLSSLFESSKPAIKPVEINGNNAAIEQAIKPSIPTNIVSKPIADKGLFNSVITKPSGINVPNIKAPSNIKAEKTTQLSKQRLEKTIIVNPTPPQPVIVQNQKREEKKISRRKEPNDLSLAFMGQGNF